MLMTGSGALRSNLKALNQSLSAQVLHPLGACKATEASCTSAFFTLGDHGLSIGLVLCESK